MGPGLCIINEGQILYPVYRQRDGGSFLALVLPLQCFYPHAERAACSWLSIDLQNWAKQEAVVEGSRNDANRKTPNLGGRCVTLLSRCWAKKKAEGCACVSVHKGAGMDRLARLVMIEAHDVSSHPPPSIFASPPRAPPLLEPAQRT